MEKSFTNLIEEVQKPGLCHRCGGCVTFCSAINFGALELGPDGSPRYKDPEKCIECGICYMICPVNHELDNETRNLVNWHEPMGNVIGTTVARAMDPEVRAAGTDGGVVTAILLRLFDQGRIDGAIVCRQDGPFLRRPALARTREDILAAAGSHYDLSHGMAAFGDEYATYTTYSPSIQAFGALSRNAWTGWPSWAPPARSRPCARCRPWASFLPTPSSMSWDCFAPRTSFSGTRNGPGSNRSGISPGTTSSRSTSGTPANLHQGRRGPKDPLRQARVHDPSGLPVL